MARKGKTPNGTGKRDDRKGKDSETRLGLRKFKNPSPNTRLWPRPGTPGTQREVTGKLVLLWTVLRVAVSEHGFEE